MLASVSGKFDSGCRDGFDFHQPFFVEDAGDDGG
jgi:hypothetical protein